MNEHMNARDQSIFGYLGLLLGVLAFAAALAHFFLGPVDEPPPLEEVVAEKALDIRDAVIAGLRNEEREPARAPSRVDKMDKDDLISNATVAAGFLAMVLAAISFIRREDVRVAGVAAVFGSMAIAFKFLTIALGVIVIAILIGATLNAIGFEFD